MRAESWPRAETLALCALAALAAWAPAAGQQSEDRPLPPSPCPDVFTYESATVDWDRWYGMVLVSTNTPLTGLRLDVWLSRPALALRHNWVGNVTTLDSKRFTILNLYERVEPGPPLAIRIIVKFDENEDIPFLQAVELNGRSICGARANPQTFDDRRPQATRPRPSYGEEDVVVERHPPQPQAAARFPPRTHTGASAYEPERATPRAPNPAPAAAPAAGSFDNPYDSYEQDYRNTVNKAPASSVGDYERNDALRPAARPPPVPAPTPAPARRPDFQVDRDPDPDRYNRPKERPQFETPPRAASQPAAAVPSRVGPDQRKPSSGGGGKLPEAVNHAVNQAVNQRAPADATAARRKPAAPAFEETRPAAPPPRRDAAPGSNHGPAPGADAHIDVRFDPQPLSHERPGGGGGVDRFEEESAVAAPGRRPAERPLRVPEHPAPERPPPAHRKPPPSHALEDDPPPPPEHGVHAPGSRAPLNGDHHNNDRWQAGSHTTESPHYIQRPTHHEAVGEEHCGRTLSVAPLITHGHNTSRGQWPWHAALYQAKGTDLKYICGGTLVSSNFIVTAAHCVTRQTTGRAVDPDTIIAYLGKYHLHRWTNEEGVQQGKVAAIHVHPEYNTTDFRADIALLELSTSLSYTQYVRHVCLWDPDESTSLNNLVGHEGYVVGWGYDEYGDLTEELRMATLPIVSEQKCLRSYPEFFSRFSNEKTFCGGSRNGTSACNGDSGGGMVLARPASGGGGGGGGKAWVLRGLVSVSVARDDKRVCNTEHYVVFTDVAKYSDWIRSYLQ